MKLQREATQYMEAKREKYKNDLIEKVDHLDKFLVDNLEEDELLKNARDRLIECKLWAMVAYK